MRMRPKSSGEVLKTAQARAFLVTDLTNIHFLTGMRMSAGFALLEAKSITLYVDGRYRDAAVKNAVRGVKVRDITGLPKVLVKLRKCAIESENITLWRMRNWKRKYTNTKFVQTRGIVEEFRRTKSEEELRSFRRAQRITREVIARVPSVLRRAITERELAWMLRSWAMELGADDLAFDPIVAFGSNTSSPHHHPGNLKLRKGHIVQIDFGAKYRGYCADQSAVFFTAKPTPLQRRVYDAVKRAKEAATEAVCAGVTNHELDRIARSVLKKEKLEKYFIHSLGHGVGLEIHEGPSLSEKADKVKLLRNEIITIEPGVYIPGKFGMRLEEEIIVT